MNSLQTQHVFVLGMLLSLLYPVIIIIFIIVVIIFVIVVIIDIMTIMVMMMMIIIHSFILIALHPCIGSGDQSEVPSHCLIDSSFSKDCS